MPYAIRDVPPCLAVDSDMVFSDTGLDAIWAYGGRLIITYAEILTAQVLARYTAKHFAVSVITYSRKPGWTPNAATGAADAKRALDVVHSLGVPSGLTIWDDCEGPAPTAPVHDFMAHVDAHAAAVAAAGDVAGDYLGYGCPLTSTEWYARPNVHAYWKSGGLVTDRMGNAVDTRRGYQLVQLLPFNQNLGAGAIVDLDGCGGDYLGSRVKAIYAA